MDRVEEIESAIAGLPPEEFRRIVDWLQAREQKRWDEQMDHDCSTGKLDFLFEETEIQPAKGRLREWPPRE
jgi:DNA-binding transcriptional regulator YdaS (Cro superfamily)